MKSKLIPRFLTGFYAIASVLSCFENADAYSWSAYEFRNLTRVARQASECKGFKCRNTDDCIDDEKRCDGAVDCPDGSDEFDDCKTLLTCPGYLFTCDYGACIDLKKQCDGKKDCRDNSDEVNCIINTSAANKISSNCKSDQFECKSGQCRPLDDKCSGTAECDDRSDETKETCLNMFCPGYTFKCDYGACIDGFARCDGKKDCLDNSDEENCGPKVPPIPIPKPTDRPVVTSEGGCALPEHPQFGQWSIVSGVKMNPQQLVPSSTTIEFQCNSGYKLLADSPYAVCLPRNGFQWSLDIWPTCVKKCQPLYSLKHINIKCFNSKNIEVKCDEATHGTSATFTCDPYYEPADQRKVTRYCWDGTWNLPAPVCQPVCGEKTVSAKPLIVNGTLVEKGNYPWVTALYHKDGDDFMNVCAGSMLTQRIILTAAHCVTDKYGKFLPKENMMIGVGKYYNKYKDPRDTEAQYSELEKVIVPKFYKGDTQRYASDIALLITKDELLLSKIVQPVCYQALPDINLRSGLEGVVTGWGYTVANDSPSDVLLEINLPYKTDEQCFQELPSDWSDKYYTPDKLCAGHYNKSISVCSGDSGGGLVYKYDKDNRYYVHGIVSVGHTTEGACDTQVSALFTKVAAHYNWLEKEISQYTSAR